MKYKVIWIDDNPEDNEALFDKAIINEIDLVHFYTSKEGMEELERNIELYDAVILDGLVFKDSRDEKASLEGLQNSISKLNELKNKRLVPYFIYSGYLGSDKYDAVRELLSADKIYKKPGDSNLLFKDILLAINEQEITQLKHKYTNAFELCSEEYLGEKEFDRLLQIVKDIENPEDISNPQDALLPMRKFLEALFKKLHSIGLVPDEIQNAQGAISGASNFLAGNNKGYQYNDELIHPVIAEKIHHLLKLTQDAAHNDGHVLKVDTYLIESSNTFLYRSLCFSLLEVLDYFKSYLDQNYNIEMNLLKWSVKEEFNHIITGTIEQDENRNYHCYDVLFKLQICTG